MKKENEMTKEETLDALIETIEGNEQVLRDWCNVTPKYWKSVLNRLANFKPINGEWKECYDEEIWTFLVAVAYARSGKTGIQSLLHALTGDEFGESPTGQIWLEALPLPPRDPEGNTNLDLCIGGIAKRGKTIHGIEFDGESDFSVFCEMKWYSDLSYGVTGDPHRNQLIRVIENALTFQGPAKPPAKLYVALVTPAVFKGREPASRFYHYKFKEYSNKPKGVDAILSELDSCKLKEYKCPDWNYPRRNVLEDRVKALKLNWTTYEDLIGNAPDNVIAHIVKKFERLFNDTGRAKL